MDRGDFSHPVFSSLNEDDSFKVSKTFQSIHQVQTPSKLRIPFGAYYADSDDNDQINGDLGQSQTEVSVTPLSVNPKFDKNELTPSEEKNNKQKTYNKKPGTANIRGQLYKIGLSTLLLHQRLTKKIDGFHLAANMEEAGEFKDVVFRYKYKHLLEEEQNQTEKSKIIFLHSKHVDIAENKKITVDSLLSDSVKKGDLDINLPKHFSSYREIKRQFIEEKGDHPIFGNSFDDLDIDFIIYSNVLPTFTENKEIFKRMDEDPESVLHFDEWPHSKNYYKIILHGDAAESRTESEKIIDVLQSSSDCRKLAKELAKSVFPHKESTSAEVVNQGILKKYHIPLAQTVVQKKEKKAKKGMFNRVFLDCDESLSQEGRVFRNEFFEEAKKITGKSENDLKQELQSKIIKLSDKFGVSTGSGDDLVNLSLPNDSISECEIQEFLSKLKFFVGQPNERQLDDIIKNKIKSAFSVEQGDITLLFSDIKTKVERWWKEKSFYLTEKNRFYQDSIRISIFFDVKKPVELFTGRKQELDALHRMIQLNLESPTVISQMTVITGLGGIGKTELARQYIHKHSEDYDNNIIWINAESYGTLVKSFHNLAQDKLKIRIKNADEKGRDIKSIVEEVYKYFSKRKSLFIFDNAETGTSQEDEGIDKFLPSLARNDKSHVLITSRSQEWKNAKILSLDVFPEEESVEFIRRALNIENGSQESEIKQLSETLQHFPLALRQAVAYIRQENKQVISKGQKFSINDYLEEYKAEETKPTELLDYQLLDSNDYQRTTFITWNITLEKIKKMDYGDQALDILDMIAYFAPDNISTKVFLGTVTDKRELGSALQLLKGYSIIGVDEGEANIHRLVQHVRRLELKAQNREKRVLTDVMNLIKKAMVSEKKISCKYTSHAVSAWAYTSKYEELVKDFSNLPSAIMFELDSSARYEEAYAFGLKASKLLESVLGSDRFDTLLTMNGMAIILDHRGKYDEALKTYQYVLSKFTHTLGAEHFVTLAVKNDMAAVLKDQGKYDEALKASQEVLDKRKQILGEAHPDTLTTMNNIAIVLKSQGKYDKALETYQEIVEKREQILGSDHRDTLMTKHGMALVYYHQGKYDEAFKIYQEVLSKRSRILGPDHPDTLMTKHNMTSILCNKQKYEDALLTFQELVDKTRQILGPDHPHTIRAKNGIARVFYEQGNYDGALLAYQEVFDKKEKFLGPDHPDTLQTQYDISAVLLKQGKYDEVLLAYLDLIDKENRIFGPDHPITLATQHNKALVLSKQAKYDESLLLYREVLGKKERVFGPDHPNTLATQHNIAGVLSDQGKYNEALKSYQDVLNKRKKSLGIAHPDVFMTKRNIAAVLSDQGNYGKALEIYREALHETKQVLGPDHPDTLVTQRNVAAVIHRLGRYDEALLAYQEVMEKAKQILSPDHPDNLVTLSNIADVLDDKGYYRLALKTYEEVLGKRRQIFGSDHPDTLMTKSHIAAVLYNQGNHDTALKACQEVYGKRKQVLGPDHPAVLRTQNNIARALNARGNHQASLKAYQDVLNKRKQILGPDHPDTLETQNDIVRALCGQGKYVEALAACHDVLDKRKRILGPSHPSTLDTHNDMGIVLHKHENYMQALKAHEEVLEKRKQILGTDHPQTLVTLSNIAEVLDDQGYHDLALKAHQGVLHKREQFLGPDHPDTLTTKNNIAGVLFNQRSYEKSLKCYRDVFDKRKQILGSDHQSTLLTQNNMAAVLHTQGNLEEALKTYKEVLDKREQVLGPNHPDTLVTLSNIARVLDDQRCFDLSLKVYEDVLEKRTQVWSPDHPETVQTKNCIAGVLFNQGNYDMSLKTYQEVLDKRRQILGPDSPAVLATQNNIAAVLHNKGNCEEALVAYQEVLDRRKQILGPDHPDTLHTMDNIATVLYYQNKYDEASKIDQEMLAKKKQVLGPDHPSTLFTANRLAKVLGDEGIYEDVFKDFLEVLEKAKVLEIYHSDPLSTGRIILHMAAREGQLDVIKHLVESGADVLTRNNHDTLLHQAITGNNTEVIKVILHKIQEKAENVASHVDAPDQEGDTPLMWAAETGKLSAAQMLLEYGANVNAKNKTGQTALHWAAKGGYLEIAQFLLYHQADPNVKDEDGRTALDLSYENLGDDVSNRENLKTIAALLLSVTGEPLDVTSELNPTM